MDKDHKITAQALGADQLGDLLNRLENGSDTSAPLKETEYEDDEEGPGNAKANNGAKSKSNGPKTGKK